jgi:hypothetical protein
MSDFLANLMGATPVEEPTNQQQHQHQQFQQSNTQQQFQQTQQSFNNQELPEEESPITRLTTTPVSNTHNFMGGGEISPQNKAVQETLHALGLDPDFGNFSEEFADDGQKQNQTQQQNNTNNQFNNQQQQQVDADGQPLSHTDQIINNFLKTSVKPDNMKGIDMRKVWESVTSGDPSGFEEALQKTADNAMRNGVGIILNMMPEIYAGIEARVKQAIQGDISENSIWSEFTTKFPQFAPYKKMISPTLIQAVKHNKGNKSIAFEALKQVYSGLASSSTQQAKTQRQGRVDNTFNIRSYLK